MVDKVDLVLKGGRVIDPAQGLDAVMNVAIADGRIAGLGAELPAAAETVDVAGRLVIPGMIDTHAHVYQHVGGAFGLNPDLARRGFAADRDPSARRRRRSPGSSGPRRSG